MKNTGSIIIRISLGILFLWGGLEKFIEGFLGGVGLKNMADFLKASGLAFLGDTGNYIMAIVLASTELIAAILLFANKKLFYAYGVLAVIILMALVLVWIPKADWMNIMIHIGLFGTLVGMALTHKNT